MRTGTGKVAIVTGAASGIGKATAALFAAEGAKVIAADVGMPELEGAIGVAADAGDEADGPGPDRARACSELRRARHLLRQCRHFRRPRSIFEQSVEDWQEILRVNLIGPFLAIKHAAPAMKERGGGSIICTASVAGIRAGAGGPAYSASKAGVINLVEVAATQLCGANIRVNAICPGLIETGMTRRIYDMAREQPARKTMIGHLNPLKRGGEPMRSPSGPVPRLRRSPATSTATPWSSTAAFASPPLQPPEPTAARPSDHRRATMATLTPDKTDTSPISTHRHGDVLIVTSNNPPVNALGAAVRQGLVAAIEEAEADEAIKAVVIRCEGQTFFAGADITEFGKPPVMPWLPSVVDAIEDCSKPVVAAIHGTALGGGLEVALGCHYRVAVPTAKLGVPEVKLGLLPGAGGTQRLPRVAGVQQGAGNVASGTPIGAKEAFDMRPRRPHRRGRSACSMRSPMPRRFATSARCPNRASARTRSPSADPAVFDDFRKANARKFRGFEAPENNIQAVEAAVAKPYAEGVIDERKLFMELMSGTQARAQQYFFFAERKAAKIEGIARGHPAARHQARRRDRRRHHGRRHFDELPVGRHPRDDRRDEPGSARPRHRRHAQELRSERRQGPHDRRAGREGAWASSARRSISKRSRTAT